MTYTARNVGSPSAFSAPAGRSRGLGAAGLWLALVALLVGPFARPAAAAAADPDELFKSVVNRALDLVEPPEGQAPQTFSAKVKVVKADGLDGQALGATADVGFQAPDRVRASATFGGQTYAAGRDRQELWVHEPGKKFALLAR